MVWSRRRSPVRRRGQAAEAVDLVTGVGETAGAAVEDPLSRPGSSTASRITSTVAAPRG